MAVASIVAQLQGVQHFFESQASLVSDEMLRANMEAMGNSIVMQIKGLRQLDFACANSLNRAIASSAFHSDAKTLLATAVGERALALIGSSSHGGGHQGHTQTMSNPLGYFTHEDWAYWDEHKTPLQRMQYLIHKIVSYGLVHPSEQTIRKLVGMIGAMCAADGLVLSEKALYGLVVDLKTGVEPHKGKVNIIEYPDDPANLPDDIKQSAFGDKLHTVVRKELPLFNQMCRKVVLRTNHKSIREPVATPPPAQQAGTNVVGQLLAMLQQHQQQPGGVSLTYLKPPQQIEDFRRSPSPPDSQSSGMLALPWHRHQQSSPQDSQDSLPAHHYQQVVHTAADEGAPAPADAVDNVRPAYSGNVASIVDAMEQVATGTKPSKKRPAAAPPPPVMSPKPAAATPADVSPAKKKPRVNKKPAAALAPLGQAVGACVRPPTPGDDLVGAIYYNGGKIYGSTNKQEYRVIRTIGDRVDAKVKWASHGQSRDVAWTKALELIDNRNN